jgi:sulfide:quinone oxidoreductase
LAAAAETCNARYHKARLLEVDSARRSVRLSDRTSLRYDALLLAVGTRSIGVLPGAITFPGRDGSDTLAAMLDDVAAGRMERIAFALPDGVHWSLPIYELALMTAAHAGAHRRPVEIHVVTPEARPLAIFGRSVSEHIATLLDDAGIQLRTQSVPLAVQPGRLLVSPAAFVPADRVVALPRLRVDAIPGVPQRRGGFIPVDEFGAVDGLTRVYAAGDATWHPVKQGGLATQQADAAASAIAAAAGAQVTPQAFEPVLRGILLTGGSPEYLRHEGGDAGAASNDALWWPPGKGGRPPPDSIPRGSAGATAPGRARRPAPGARAGARRSRRNGRLG